jgi:hypothetical protein
LGPYSVARTTVVVKGRAHSIVNGVTGISVGVPEGRFTAAEIPEAHCRPAASRS